MILYFIVYFIIFTVLYGCKRITTIFCGNKSYYYDAVSLSLSLSLSLFPSLYPSPIYTP